MPLGYPWCHTGVTPLRRPLHAALWRYCGVGEWVFSTIHKVEHGSDAENGDGAGGGAGKVEDTKGGGGEAEVGMAQLASELADIKRVMKRMLVADLQAQRSRGQAGDEIDLEAATVASAKQAGLAA